MKKRRHHPLDKRLVLLAAAVLLIGGLWFVVPKIFALVSGSGTSCPKATMASAGRENTGPVTRGNIYDRHGTPVAISLPLFSVYVKPVELRISSKQEAFLAAAFKTTPDSLEKQLKSERCVVWLARYIGPEIAEEIRQQQIQGLYLVSEPQRYYPEGEIGAHVIGCFKDGHGLAGLEFTLDQVLQGSESGAGQEDPALQSSHLDNIGRQVILQLDTGLQKTVAVKLAELQEKSSAEAVWGVVMEPASGAVLAMASLPEYDPNRFWEVSEEALVNRAIRSRLPIGSLSGLFNLAEALDSGKSLGESGDSSAFEKDFGLRMSESGDFVSEALWRLLALAPDGSLPEINKFFQIGALKIVKNGAAEAEQNNVADPQVKVSALQLLSGFSALVNGGKVPTPQLVNAVCDREGAVREENKPSATPVLKPETSGMLKALLASGGSDSVLFCSLQQRTAEETGNDPVQPKEQSKTAQETTPGQGCHFDAIMLGYLSGKKGNRVMVVGLQDGSNAANFKLSSWQASADAILKKAVGVQDADKVQLTAASLHVDIQAAYKRWRTLQGKAADRELRAVSVKKEMMPRVTGLSLRKALHILEPMGRPFSIEGSGVVVAQQPRPGAPLRNGAISLRLQPDAGSIRSL